MYTYILILRVLIVSGVPESMDESWRMRMGMPSLPRRRSTEDASSKQFIFSRGGGGGEEAETLDPEDFADVFGGPPRSVLMRKFSGDFFKNNGEFYGEVFRPPEFVTPADKDGRSLPAFRIPARGGGGGGGGGGFYGDIFGSEDDLDRKSRERSRPNSKAKSKSKSNSSSVLSSEDLSPLHRPVIGDDVALSSFVSKLRLVRVRSNFFCTVTSFLTVFNFSYVKFDPYAPLNLLY